MLDMELDPLSSGILVDYQTPPAKYLRHIRRCLADAGNIREESSALGGQERVGIVCSTHVDAGGLQELTDLLALTCVEIREVNFVIVEDHSSSLADQLSSFMRGLVRRNMIENVSFHFRVSDPSCYGAVFSVLPALQALKSFSVQADDLQHGGHSNDFGDGAKSYYSWLSYTLRACRVGRHTISAEVQLAAGSDKLVTDALTTPCALLRDLPHQRDFNPTVLLRGTSATVRPEAELTTAITRRIRLREKTVAFVAMESQRVDIVATYNDTNAIIVWPGIGLMCVDINCLDDWDTHASPSLADANAPYESLVRDVMCARSDCTAVAAFVEIAGAKLHRLGLANIASEDEQPFERILHSCRQLETLTVETMTVVDPLLSAYEANSCCISNLVIGEAPLPVITAILEALSENSSRMTAQVKALCFDRGSFETDLVETVANLLGSNRRLQYVRLDEVRDDDELRIGDILLGGFVDQPAGQTLQSKRAAYAFLLSARRHRILRLLPQPCAQPITAFAATLVLRQVSWEEFA